MFAMCSDTLAINLCGCETMPLCMRHHAPPVSWTMKPEHVPIAKDTCHFKTIQSTPIIYHVFHTGALHKVQAPCVQPS